MKQLNALIICISGIFIFPLPVSILAQDVIWKKNFGGPFDDAFYSVTKVPDGVVAVGIAYISLIGAGDWQGMIGKGYLDAIIVKYDNDGNIIWKNNFGGYGNDIFYSVTTVSDGIVAVGRSYSSSFGNGDWESVEAKGWSDAIIVKYDNNGNVIWKKSFGSMKHTEFKSVSATHDGVVVVGSSSLFGEGDWEGILGKGAIDAIIVKYDNNGNVIWKKNFGGNDDDNFYSVTSVLDGIIAVGQSAKNSFGNGDWEGVDRNASCAIIVKYDNAGNVIWKKNFIGQGHFHSVTEVSDGMVAVGTFNPKAFGNGDLDGIVGRGSYDVVIVKYDNMGNVVWKRNFGGIYVDFASYVLAVPGGFVVTGVSDMQSFGTGDWIDIQGKGDLDVTLVKFDHAGNEVWKTTFGGIFSEHFNGLTVVNDNLIVVGQVEAFYSGTGDWEDVVSKGGSDAFIIKYSLDEMGIDNPTQELFSIKVYPNPTTGYINIESEKSRIESIEIFDIYGKKLYLPTLSTIHSSTTNIDISYLSTGLYFLKISTESGEVVKKVLKQ